MRKKLTTYGGAGLASFVIALVVAGAAHAQASAKSAAAAEVHAATPQVAKAALGKKLYFEEGVSVNNTQSCNSCHPIDNKGAGVDHLKTGKGALGKSGDRNDPPTMNAGFQIAQFWDGRAATLEEQAQGPPLKPIEMGMPNAEDVAERLAGGSGSHVAPALWGANSYNNGAGMNRLLTAAAFIHSNMPRGTLWNHPAITNEDVYDIAAYLSSKARPQMSGLEKDYPKLEKKAVDCPYPPYADDFSQEQHRKSAFLVSGSP